MNRLIHNPASLFIFYHHSQIFRLRSVHIDWDRPRALGSGDENHPLPLVLGKAQKISFPIHLKIHVSSPCLDPIRGGSNSLSRAVFQTKPCHPERSCRSRSERQRSRRTPCVSTPAQAYHGVSTWLSATSHE